MSSRNPPLADIRDPEGLVCIFKELSIKPMRTNTLSIIIKTSAQQLFEFTLNPNNTPLWIDGIIQEEIDTENPQLGTHYKNQSREGGWNEYEVVEFMQNKTFTFKQVNGNYFVKYDFEKIVGTETKMTYTEWVSEGELDNPFSMQPLEKLKSIIESKNI